MKLKITLLVALSFISFGLKAQFVGNIVEHRISSGADGNYIFLIDDDYLLKNEGKLPTPYLQHKGIVIERSIDNINFTLIDTLSPIQSLEDFNAIWGENSAQELLKDTTYFDFSSSDDFINYFKNSNSQFYQLYLFPLKLFKTIGFMYKDEQVEKGVTYYYRLRYPETEKIILTEKVLTGAENKTLQKYKFNFNQASIRSVDSLLVGSWVFLENNLRMVNTIDIYGKKTFDKEFELINHISPTFLSDTILASVFQKVNTGEVWQVYLQPKDIIGNKGVPSDTATLISISTGKLPFVKNFNTKDTTNAVYLTWDPLPAHSYLSAYLLSKTDQQNKFSILDTIPLNITEFYDYDVETGSTYNYEIQPIGAPVSNFRTRDFVPVRASGTHAEIQRVLPPQNFKVSQEGPNFRINWSPVEDDRISFYEVLSNSKAANSPFRTIAIINKTDTTYLDTLQYGDFNHLTRYYTLKSVSYAQKYSDIAPPVSITPELMVDISAPYGLSLRSYGNNIKVIWDQDLASENWIKGYKVFRSYNNQPWALLNPDSLMKTYEFLDTKLASGRYAYKIQGVSISGNESDFSPIQEIDFKGIIFKKESSFASVNYRNIPPGIEVSWRCVLNQMPTHVAIYRRPVLGANDYTLIAKVPVSQKRYWDKEPKIGETYFYAVEAVFEGQPKVENLEFVRPFMRTAAQDKED